MPELAHRARLDLADALAREVEVLADLLEGARLAAVEAEAQAQDLALALVERREQPADLLGQDRDRGRFEGGLRGAVLDDVTELGVTVLAQRLGQAEGLCAEAKRLDELVLGHLALDAELLDGGRPSELELE